MPHIQELRQRLIQRRVTLFRQVTTVEDDLRFLESHVAPELEEESQEDNIARLLARLDDRSMAEMEAIDAALHRIETGDYGFCEECGEEIALERLQALPTAHTCISCAEARERAEARQRVAS